MSEKEMLLLSNYVYMNISTDEMSIGDSIERFRNVDGGFDAGSVKGAGIGGGLTPDEAADLFTRIDEMPQDFKNLYPSKVLNDNDIRGICYTKGKSETGEGCVVFRGTGGTYEAWHDNVLGQAQTDTTLQMRAAEFVDNECALYSNLSVCGHSKGGNLAMYTTVVSSAAVTACVSFDGQGFSRDFITKYSDEVAAARGRIKSVCAHNDYVNVLLNPIAGETVYTENAATGINAHSSYYMLISNEYDENGNIVSLRNQSLLSEGLRELVSGVSDRLNMLPGSGNRDFSGLLAAMVAGIISSEKSEQYESGRVLDATCDVGEYLMSANSTTVPNPIAVAIRLSALSNEAAYGDFVKSGNAIEDVGLRVKSAQNELDQLALGLNPNNRIDCYISTRLEGIQERLRINFRDIMKYSDGIKDIGNMYARSEKEVCNIIS